MSAGTAGTDTTVDRLTGLPWVRLALVGVAAFVTGYVLTVLVAVLGPSSVSGNPVDVLVLLVFLFYSAHNVPLDVTGIGRVDWLAQVASPQTPEPATPVIVYYAIPVLALLLAGALVVWLLDRRRDPVRVVAGVFCFAVVYGALAVVGTFLVTSTSLFGGPATLVTVDAAVFGLAYPLAFGLVGAGLAGLATHFRKSRTTPAG